MPAPAPGEVYYLPPEEGSHDKDDLRPHVVISPPDQNDVLVTVAYISTRRLQAERFGAPHVYVDDAGPLFSLTGLARSSYIYPSRLAVCYTKDLPHCAGKIIDELSPLLDEAVPAALGLASGVSATQVRRRRRGRPPARRGQIAVFSKEYRPVIGTPFGLVVTEPAYSRRRQVQNIVPIFDAQEYEEVPPAFAVRPSAGGSRSAPAWTRQLGKIRAPLFMVQLVQSAYEGSRTEEAEIAGYLAQAVDDATMQRVDEALCARLYGASLNEVLARAPDPRE
jgi:hypothetical protein